MLRACEAWSPETYPGIVVRANGQVPMLEAERMAGAVGRLLTRFRIERSARIRMTGGPCVDGSILIQVNLESGATPLRVQTLMHGRGDALPVIVRLERQLRGAGRSWSPRPWPDPTRPPLDWPGPGVVARRKQVALARVEPISAAMAMDAMDYDVHLFTDADTGCDAIVYRALPTGVRLFRQRCGSPPRGAAATEPHGPLITNPRPAPVLAERRAADRLCEFGLPFLFYSDAATGRGRLMYRRYDSGVGLIEPVAS
ncbi:sigma 54 modulation/S30EA ribosomal C-terminal domain-containing protein [Nocardia seriolae]|uniref:sigma 54 modulation/S30EA ribosomal C-terminal domain-containing protein n=1 Tax=Nocardia seriolae TaxID=37332 RepID=UPI0011AB63FF|nr:sigma 54 modulation/S30EA ribosomal C-terminal domain-containing protein [Nocardia seriolae]